MYALISGHSHLVKNAKTNKAIIGWREWVGLPDLKIDRIKAKIDTGARTSALHALQIEPFTKADEPWVSFIVHPVQRSEDIVIQCEARVVSQRTVTNSGGSQQMRYVVETLLCLGDSTWPIELTLANRASLGFRMLIGRTALKGRAVIDPSVSYRGPRNMAQDTKVKATADKSLTAH